MTFGRKRSGIVAAKRTSTPRSSSVGLASSVLIATHSLRQPIGRPRSEAV